MQVCEKKLSIKDELGKILSRLRQSKQNCKEKQELNKKYKKYKNKNFKKIKAKSQ